MNLLDENIPEQQRLLLSRWRIRTRLIGADFSRKGIQDDEIVPLLHSLDRPTFFTRDQGFYRRDLSHSGYCLVNLGIHRSEVALFIRRFLRHPDFRTRAQRMGRVVRVSTAGIHWWQRHHQAEQRMEW